MATRHLEGRVAIVTGASRGLGKCYAMALAEAGAKVAVAARSDAPSRLPGTIQETVDEIRKLGGEAMAVRCDVGVPADLQYLVGDTVYRYGRIDILVNNAANAHRMPFFNVSPEWWDAYFRTNLRAAFLLAQAVAPHMMRQGGGSIVNITSGAATAPLDEHLLAHHGLYMISKAALDRLTEYLAAELKPHNIAVNALSPGAVETDGIVDRVPQARREGSGRKFAKPSVELVREGIVTLACQRADGITGRIVNASDYPALSPAR
jgi:citronellol/citronellal dehydrogenase